MDETPPHAHTGSWRGWASTGTVNGRDRGRPAYLTPTVEHQVASLVAHGLLLGDAARALGLGERTVRRWLALGRRGAPTYRSFAEAIDAARVEREQTIRQLVEHAGARPPRRRAVAHLSADLLDDAL